MTDKTKEPAVAAVVAAGWPEGPIDYRILGPNIWSAWNAFNNASTDLLCARSTRQKRNRGRIDGIFDRRMKESQQMRWSQRSADLLLQVRHAAYSGTLGAMFRYRSDRTADANAALTRGA